MPEFLSDAWITEMDALLVAATPPKGIPDVVIEQHVDDTSYQVIINQSRCYATAGAVQRPTVTYRQSRDTAVAIAREERTAHEAFMLGDLVVEGDPSALVDAREALTWLGEILAPLRAETTFA